MILPEKFKKIQRFELFYIIIWTADDATTDGEDVAGLHPLTGELLGGTWRTVAVAVSIF